MIQGIESEKFGGKWGGRRYKSLDSLQREFMVPEDELAPIELGLRILDILISEEPVNGVTVGDTREHHCTESCKKCHAVMPVREIDLVRITTGGFSQPEYLNGILGRVQVTELDIHNMTIHNSLEGIGSIHGPRRIEKDDLLRVLFGH